MDAVVLCESVDELAAASKVSLLSHTIVFWVVSHKSIPTQIRQLVLCVSNSEG